MMTEFPHLEGTMFDKYIPFLSKPPHYPLEMEVVVLHLFLTELNAAYGRIAELEELAYGQFSDAKEDADDRA